MNVGELVEFEAFPLVWSASVNKVRPPLLELLPADAARGEFDLFATINFRGLENGLKLIVSLHKIVKGMAAIHIAIPRNVYIEVRIRRRRIQVHRS